MTEFDYPAWIVLAFGIYAFGAGVGELRQPGFWGSMIADVERQPAMRFLTGILCIAIGTPLFLVAPWDTGDWMAIIIKVIGAWMVVEGALFLAIGDIFVKFAARMMGMVDRFWAWISVLLGILAILASLARLQD